MRVLLIEDDPRIADFVRDGLGARGCEVTHCADGREGYERGLRGDHDAIVLDLTLPGRDGLDVLDGLRRAGVQAPVLLLTARNELGDRIDGLARGADDYLGKPFYVEELAARLEALARRVSPERQHTRQSGGLTLDRLARRARVGAREVELTAREFALLEVLMRAPGEVFSRARLLEQVWGHDFDPGTNVVDVAVRRLRARLAEAGAGGGDDGTASPVEAVRGLGYRFRRDDPGT